MSFKNFLKCGLTGWCIEIIFTGLTSIQTGVFDLSGHTSLWMFPIYGLAVFFIPLYQFIHSLPKCIRAAIYATLIMLTEFLTGMLLTTFGVCPWCYEGTRFSFCGVIRFDYFPLWMLVGLLFEQLLCKKNDRNKFLVT